MKSPNIYSRFSHLYNFLKQQAIHVLDIGGRGGPIEDLKGFSYIADLIIVEPEPKERKRLENECSLTEEWNSLTLIEKILAESNGKYRLNICVQPGLSSLYLPNMSVISQYYSDSSDWAVENSVNLPGDTLSSQLKKANLEDSLDILKLDTQGSELSIIKSLNSDSLSNVKLVYVESELQEFYQGQPLSGDLHQFMAENAFTILDIKKTKLRANSDVELAFSRQESVWLHLCYINSKCLTNLSLDLKSIACLIAAGYLDRAAVYLSNTKLLPQADKELILKDLKEFSKHQFRKNKIKKLKSLLRQFCSGINATSTSFISQDKWSDQTIL